MLTRSRRRQGQISSEQEGRDVTDEAPSVDGEGTEEPTAMNDGGDANASGSRSSNLSPLTGSETSEEAAIDGGSELLVQQYDDGGTGTPHARRALPDVARAARASPGAARNAVDAADRWRLLGVMAAHAAVEALAYVPGQTPGKRRPFSVSSPKGTASWGLHRCVCGDNKCLPTQNNYHAVPNNARGQTWLAVFFEGEELTHAVEETPKGHKT
ncbi:hypothetical protein NFJ02_04g115420 [Pycnococcus provasolii]